MAKWQDVLNLSRSALQGNREQVINACRCIVANEPENSSLKEQLSRLLARSPGVLPLQDQVPKDLVGLVLQFEPSLTLADLELPSAVIDELAAFLEEQAHVDAIHAAGLSVPHKILIAGPPGNGKTTLAGAIALERRLPFYIVDFSALVSSHLGETGAKVAKLFRGITEKPAVLLVDEMETVLAERAGVGNATDVAEMRRIVSTVLMEIDRLPDHVVLVGATNHAEMLDRAVVRRFDLHWALPSPDQAMVQRWLARFAARYPDIPVLTEMPQPTAAGTSATGKSIAEYERETKKWCRRWIVGQSARRGASGTPPALKALTCE